MNANNSIFQNEPVISWTCSILCNSEWNWYSVVVPRGRFKNLNNTFCCNERKTREWKPRAILILYLLDFLQFVSFPLFMFSSFTFIIIYWSKLVLCDIHSFQIIALSLAITSQQKCCYPDHSVSSFSCGVFSFWIRYYFV